MDTSFSDEQFLPPEETPDYLRTLPEPLRPNTYTVIRDIKFLERDFETGADPPDTFVTAPPPESGEAEGRRASERSIVTVIRSLAATDPEFVRLVARNDRDGDGIPDDNWDDIYAAVSESAIVSLAVVVR